MMQKQTPWVLYGKERAQPCSTCKGFLRFLSPKDRCIYLVKICLWSYSLRGSVTRGSRGIISRSTDDLSSSFSPEKIKNHLVLLRVIIVQRLKHPEKLLPQSVIKVYCIAILDKGFGIPFLFLCKSFPLSVYIYKPVLRKELDILNIICTNR